MLVLTNGTVRKRSTEAAREYVRVVRSRLQMEQARHGPDAVIYRSYQDLERSITPEELRRLWPHADVEAALAD